MGDTKPTQAPRRRADRRAREKKVTKEAVNRRAAWCIDEWRARPSLGYAEMKEAVRAHFECGFSAAQDTITRAYEVLEENMREFGAPRLFDAYYEIHTEQKKRNELGEARKTLDSIRALGGIGAPDRLEHSGEVEVKTKLPDVSDLSDSELRAMLKRVAPKKG